MDRECARQKVIAEIIDLLRPVVPRLELEETVDDLLQNGRLPRRLSPQDKRKARKLLEIQGSLTRR